METAKLISPGDTNLMTIVDTPEEAVEKILLYRRTVGVPESVPAAFR